MNETLTWLDMQGGYCLYVRPALRHPRAWQRASSFVCPPILSFFQPCHDLSTLAREASAKLWQSRARGSAGWRAAEGTPDLIPTSVLHTFKVLLT